MTTNYLNRDYPVLMFPQMMINNNIFDLNYSENSSMIHPDCKLYKPCDLANNLLHSTSLNMIHINIRSFHKNIDEFKVLLSNCKSYFSIIILSETWLSDVAGFVGAEFDGYDDFHVVRTGKRGGGVTILSDRSLGATKIDSMSFVDDTMELCSISFDVNETKYNVVGVYRPPLASMSSFNADFFEKLNSFNTPRSKTLIAGDFNVDLFNASQQKTCFLL